MKNLTIGKAAGKAGVGVETIRFYERRGLIARPPKPAEGFRNYDCDTVARIRFIRQAQVLGFSLREIEELLGLRADPRGDCAVVRKQAVAKRREVERKIAGLERIRTALDTLIAQCPGKGALAACTVLEAIEHAPPGIGAQNGKEKGPDPMKSMTFTIEGMHCGGCAETIKALVAAEPGVRAAEVSFEESQARVLYDPQTIDEEGLAGVIERAGYRVAARQA
ncbi:MAG: MerR family DNA-binding protein [Rhizobiaceae bacterium]|jgi:Hg(II)-responsive transcriptional regulator